ALRHADRAQPLLRRQRAGRRLLVAEGLEQDQREQTAADEESTRRRHGLSPVIEPLRAPRAPRNTSYFFSLCPLWLIFTPLAAADPPARPARAPWRRGRPAPSGRTARCRRRSVRASRSRPRGARAP